MRPIWRLALLVGILLAVTAPAVATAVAGQYGGVTITVSDTTPAPGGSETVTGDGFKPGSTVQIFILSTPLPLGTATADANGQIKTSVTIPSTFAAGSSHTIEAQGVDPSGVPLTDSISIVLAGTTNTASSGLAFTGVRIAELGGAGAALIALGSFLVFTARRRHSATRS